MNKELIELKPCPFCGTRLDKKYLTYKTGKKIAYYEHPLNGCFLECRASEMGSLCNEKDILSWNRRIGEKNEKS